VTAQETLEILDRLASAGIDAWVDGGWGVDALVGSESRTHDDLDLLVGLADVEAIRRVLESQGFALHEDELPTRFVLRAAGDRRIDFHTVTFDADGAGIQVHQDGSSFRYPPEGLVTGHIGGREVRCIGAEVQMLCHLGYEPDETDRHDVRLLHDHFGLPLPAPYRS